MHVTLDARKYVYFVDFMTDCLSLAKRTKSAFGLLKPRLFIFKKWLFCSMCLFLQIILSQLKDFYDTI